MAYASKYYLDQYSTGGIHYYIDIQKDGFVGDASKLKLVRNGLKISPDLTDWEANISTLIAQIGILNDAEDWYVFDDLMSIENTEFKVIIDASYGDENMRLFNGWVNSAPVSQQYLNNSVINLTASNFLQRMDKLTPPILNTRDASYGDLSSLIDLINGSLQLTSKNTDIYVNSTLDASGGISNSTSTLFNKCGISPYIFFDDNENKASGWDVIEDILRSFNSYLYWWDDNWYIERYHDLNPLDGAKAYVKYSYPTIDSSYWFDTNAVAAPVVEASINLPIGTCDGSMVFTGSSQTLTSIPGLEFLEIQLDESEIPNLTSNDFGIIERVASTPYNHYPDYRGWLGSSWPGDTVTGYRFPGYHVYTLLDISSGYTFNDSQNIFMSDGSAAIGTYTIGPGKPFTGLQNSEIRYGVPAWYSSNVWDHNDKHAAGLSTRFKVTVNNEETKMNVTWKYLPITSGAGGTRAWDYKCYYTIRTPDDGGNNKFIKEQDGFWELVQTSTFADYVNTTVINGADLNDSGYGTISIDIPVGDVSGLTTPDNREIIFSILGEDLKLSTDAEFFNTDNFVLMAVYGDAFITATSGTDPVDNTIIAQLNKNVLNTKKVSLKLYDTPNINIDNGVQTGAHYKYRTNTWVDDSATHRSLVNWYIHDRYQLYNKNRRELKGYIKYEGYLKPMSAWYDVRDPSTKIYILTTYTYNVDEDVYDCQWLEYDNNSVINLNDTGGDIPETSVRPSRGGATPSTPGYDGTPRSASGRTTTTSTGTRRSARS